MTLPPFPHFVRRLRTYNQLDLLEFEREEKQPNA